MKNDNDDKFPDKEGTSDFLFGIIKGGIGSIPIAGNLGAEIFGLLTKEPIEKRRQKWFNDLLKRIQDLESNNKYSLENLRENEEFISILIEASRNAIRTSNQEKLEYLKNAVINSVRLADVNEEEKFQFLFLIEFLQVSHIKMLKRYYNSNGFSDVYSDHYDVYSSSPNEFKSENEFLVIFNDLEMRGLLKRNSSGSSSITSKRFAVFITDIGIKFIRYVS